MIKGWGFKEKRQYQRIQRNFIICYNDKITPDNKYEVTQIKNISLGGLCFVTHKFYPEGSKLSFELRTPYLTDTVHLEGAVLESKEKIKSILYETRLIFDRLSSESELVLQKMVSSLVKSE